MPRISKEPAPPSAALEATLAQLEARRRELADKLAAASVEAEAATQKRRRLLLDMGKPDPDAADAADGECVYLTSRRDGLADALRALDGQIEDARQRLADEQARAAREANAKRLEDAAVQIDALAPRLRKHIADVAAVVSEIAALVPEDAGLTREFENPAFFHLGAVHLDPFRGKDIALALLADALNTALPGAFEVRGAGGDLEASGAFEATLIRHVLDAGRVKRFGWSVADFPPVDAATSARIFASDPLRARAQELRASGQADPVEASSALVAA